MEDLDLIRAVLKGDSEKYGDIIGKYEFYVFKIAINILNNKEAAEDIVQETFITAYNKLRQYKSEYKFSTWLFKIAQNKCIDYLRKRKNKNETDIEYAKDIISKEISPEDYAEYNMMKDSINEFMKSLNETDRRIVMLKSIKLLSFSDISKMLDMNESSVKKRYYKVKENFKNIYIKERSEDYEVQ